MSRSRHAAVVLRITLQVTVSLRLQILLGTSSISDDYSLKDFEVTMFADIPPSIRASLGCPLPKKQHYETEYVK